MKLRYICTGIILSLLLGCNDKVCNCQVNQETTYANDSIITNWNNHDWWGEIGIETASQFEYDFYRLTIFPSWNNSTVTQFRLENTEGKPRILIQEYQKDYSHKKYHFKKMRGPKSLTLNSKNWTEFDTFSNNKCLWNMPTIGEQYLDGVSWILEVQKRTENVCSGKRYHVVSRVGNDSSFFAICNEILKLGNSSKKEQDSILSVSWRTD